MQQVVALVLSLFLSELTLQCENECKIIKNVYEFGKKMDELLGENGIFATC